MDNEDLPVLGFAKATHRQATLLSRNPHHSAALQAADRWLAHRADAVVAIAEIEPEAGPIDRRGVGWTPLGIKDIIRHAIERHRDAVSSEVRETTS
jgi:hypothetical protein